MKSIERRFNDLQKKRPGLSSLMNFSGAVTDGRFTPAIMHRWFNRLVEKDDYDPRDKRAIFAHFDRLSNPVRTTTIEGHFALRPSPIISCVVQSV